MKLSEPFISLSLISHTNVGKTTLARTLLKQDVGEVFDRPHVTEFSVCYTMIKSEAGELRLWDTPGFGDTARLLRRLKMQGNPIGWILTQAWDRFADRPLWCSQQAVRNVRDQADAVLYLVNAAEDPQEAGYVKIEMEILTWIAKPVVLLLNQIGLPQSRADKQAEQKRWRAYLQAFSVVQEVLSLDAFTRCWIQEDVLLKAVGKMLPPDKQELHVRLSHEWRERNLRIFHQSMHSLALQLARACCDRVELQKNLQLEEIPFISHLLDIRAPKQISEKQRAMSTLAERLDQYIRQSTDEMIEFHGLKGQAAGEIFKRLENDYSTTQPLNEGISAILGGIISGALGGLAADIAAAGLTLGGGVLAGSIIGALGGKGLAKGYNLVRGENIPYMRWSSDFFLGLVRSALLRYLAVAHFGRGRGEYTESEHPEFWQNKVVSIVEHRRDEIRSLWERGRTTTEPSKLSDTMEQLLTVCAGELLSQLYRGQIGQLY